MRVRVDVVTLELAVGQAMTVAKAEKPAVADNAAGEILDALASHPAFSHTQWQKGKYTRCTQTTMKMMYGTNRTRSANGQS